MKAGRSMAPSEALPGATFPRAKKRAVVAAATVVPLGTVLRATTFRQPPQRNIQVRVIAVLITGMALLIVSLAGVRMLGTEEPQAEPSAVLAPNEVLILEQSQELDRERARARKLAEKIDYLLAADKDKASLLKEREERLLAQQDVLRDKAASLRKAREEAGDTAQQLRLAKTELEEKDRQLREKEDLLRENEARLKTYETAKRQSDQRIRELEMKLTKANTAATPARAALAEDEWPSLLKNNLALGAQVRQLKRLLEVLDKEADAEAWATTMQATTEIIDGLSGRLKRYPITDAAANEAKSFLSDTLITRLYRLKKQKR